MKKRFFAILLSALLACAVAVGLTACNDPEGSPTDYAGKYYVVTEDITLPDTWLSLASDSQWQDSTQQGGTYKIEGDKINLYRGSDAAPFLSLKIGKDTLVLNGVNYKKINDVDALTPQEEYTVTEDGKLVNYGGNAKNLILPKNVTSIGAKAFDNCSDIQSVIIRQGVKTIEKSAFSRCSELKSISIPSSVEEIETSAFSNCAKLNGVYIDDIAKWCNIKFSGSSANPLSYGKNLYLNGAFVYDLKIPDGVETINEYAFYNCSKLNSVTIPQSVKVINKDAFQNCEGLTGLYIDDLSEWCAVNIASSTANPLYYAKKLYVDGKLITNLIIPKNINEFSENTFAGGSFTSVTVPSTVTAIPDNAFSNCLALESVTLTKGVASIGEAAFSRTGLKQISIPDSVTSIGKSAFKSCKSLLNILLPDSIESIGSEAFYASGLSKVVIPNSVNEIGSGAFAYCSSLTEIVIPNGVESNLVEVLFKSTALRKLTMPYIPSLKISDLFDDFLYTDYSEQVPSDLEVVFTSGTKILEDTFYRGTFITSLTLPESVTDIESDAFLYMYMPNLKKVNISSINQWLSINFSNAAANPLCNGAKLFVDGAELKDLVIADGVTAIKKYAFYGSELTSVTLPDSLTTIGDDAFGRCKKMTEFRSETNRNFVVYEGALFDATSKLLYVPGAVQSYEVPQGIASIRKGAFDGCKSLESLTLPFIGESRQLGDNSYLGFIFGAESSYYQDKCVPSSLKSVTLTEGTVVPDKAFYNCTNIVSVTLPETVTQINERAFSNCKSLTTVNIPDGVEIIKMMAFSGCESLEIVVLPDSVTKLDGAVFSDCTSLKEITFGSSLTSFYPSELDGCTGIQKLTVKARNLGSSRIQYICEMTQKATIQSIYSKVLLDNYIGQNYRYDGYTDQYYVYTRIV